MHCYIQTSVSSQEPDKISLSNIISYLFTVPKEASFQYGMRLKLLLTRKEEYRVVIESTHKPNISNRV